MLRILILSLSLSAIASAAQTPPHLPVIDSKTAKEHLLPCPAPIIPPIAKAAHVFGEVKLQVVIDATGHVKYVTTLEGPEMLKGAAINYIRSCTYRPFTVDNQATAVTTVVGVGYTSTSPDYSHNSTRTLMPEKTLDAQRLCAIAMNYQQQDAAKRAQLCGDAANLTDALPQDDFFTERRSTYVFASTAYLRNKQTKEALDTGNKAVAVVEQGHDDGASACTAYLARAEAEAVANQLQASSLDLVKAENIERDAIDYIQSDALKKLYTKNLKVLLSLHAKVLQAMGDTAGAQAKSDEAAKL